MVLGILVGVLRLSGFRSTDLGVVGSVGVGFEALGLEGLGPQL